MELASAIMTSPVVTVSPQTSVHQVAELLASKRYGSLPVVDAQGRVLGVVTEESMVQRAAAIHLPRHLEFLGGIIYLENPQHFTDKADAILAMTAEDIMEKHFSTIHADERVDVVATRLLAEDLRRLLVVGADGALLGIITRADIVRQLALRDNLPDAGA